MGELYQQAQAGAEGILKAGVWWSQPSKVQSWEYDLQQLLPAPVPGPETSAGNTDLGIPTPTPTWHSPLLLPSTLRDWRPQLTPASVVRVPNSPPNSVFGLVLGDNSITNPTRQAISAPAQ